MSLVYPTTTRQDSALDQIELEVQMITPDAAKSYLWRNSQNRNKRRRAVVSYARDMLAGEWSLVPDAIAFDVEGNLINGQHRLEACILADRAFPAIVARNMPITTRIAQDSGVKRSLSDFLRYKGESNPANLGATLSWIALYLDGFAPGQAANTMYSHNYLFRLLDTNPGIRDSMQFSLGVYRDVKIAPSIIAGVHYFGSVLDADDAMLFWEEVRTGVNLQSGSPSLALRNWIANRKAMRNNTMERRHTSAIVILAWNHWREGREVARIKFHSQTQKFPEII